MIIKDFLTINPIIDFISEYKLLFNNSDASFIDTIGKYLDQVWIQQYLNYELLDLEDVFASRLFKILCDYIPQISLNVRQHNFLVNNDVVIKSKIELGTSANSENIILQGYEGYTQTDDNTFSKNTSSNASYNDDVMNYLLLMNQNLKPIFSSMSYEIENNLRLFYV